MKLNEVVSEGVSQTAPYLAMHEGAGVCVCVCQHYFILEGSFFVCVCVFLTWVTERESEGSGERDGK